MSVAGSSRAVSLFGGDGAVNFSFLAAGAESYAPLNADRATIVSGIGRGVGRAAVHEFAHQLLGTARYEGTQDRQSYQDRLRRSPEQYLRRDPLARGVASAAPAVRLATRLKGAARVHHSTWPTVTT